MTNTVDQQRVVSAAQTKRGLPQQGGREVQVSELDRAHCVPLISGPCRHNRERTIFHDGADGFTVAASVDAFCPSQVLHYVVMIQYGLIHFGGRSPPMA